MSVEYRVAVEEARAKLISSTRMKLTKLLDDQIQANFSFNRELNREWLNLNIKKGIGKLTLFPWIAITKPTFEVIQYRNGELTREKRQIVEEHPVNDYFNDKNFLQIPGTREIITPKQVSLGAFKENELVAFAEKVELAIKPYLRSLAL